MDIKYERIVEVNKGVTYTNVKGKNYAEVAQKVQAFRNLIPGGFITSEIIRFESIFKYTKRILQIVMTYLWAIIRAKSWWP